MRKTRIRKLRAAFLKKYGRLPFKTRRKYDILKGLIGWQPSELRQLKKRPREVLDA